MISFLIAGTFDTKRCFFVDFFQATKQHRNFVLVPCPTSSGTTHTPIFELRKRSTMWSGIRATEVDDIKNLMYQIVSKLTSNSCG